jgi:hypothetical protein
MAEVERALFLSIFDIAFSGGCCSRSLVRAAEVIEHETRDRTSTVPHWFLPPPQPPAIRFLSFLASDPLASDERNRTNEEEIGRPTKRRRTGSPERRPGEVCTLNHSAISIQLRWMPSALHPERCNRTLACLHRHQRKRAFWRYRPSGGISYPRAFSSPL